MLQLDGGKFGAPTDTLRDFDKSCYIASSPELDENDKPLTKIYTLKDYRKLQGGTEKKLGIKSIAIKEDKVIMEFGSKALREDYGKLISKETIEQVLDNINATGWIDIDKGKFIDTAQCYRFDVTKDLPVTKSSDVYFRDLSILGSKRKYDIDPYKSGFVITNKAKTVDERIASYDKVDDLYKRDKWNKQLIKLIDISEFEKKRFRIEGNYRNFETIRKYFHIKKSLCRNKLEVVHNLPKVGMSLSDILTSSANPNYELFTKMFNEDIDIVGGLLLELLDSEDALYKIEKQVGRVAIIKHCDYNLMNVRRLLKSKLKAKNIGKYLRDYEQLLNKIRVSELKNYDNINEVRELLKAA